MAIYHLNAKAIARSKGQSATAAAAYRAGEKIEDRRTGITHDYTRKRGVSATEIIAPVDAPTWVKDRAELWNRAEERESRKNSRTAREFDVALPVELSYLDLRQLVRTFVSEQFTKQNLVADIAFHHLSSHNPHVHILITTRSIDRQGRGEKQRILDRKDFLVQLRRSWELCANRALERAGSDERISSLTLSAQGSDRVPQLHLGPNVVAMRKKGIATARGDEYDRRVSVNERLSALKSKLALTDREIDSERTDKRPTGVQETALALSPLVVQPDLYIEPDIDVERESMEDSSSSPNVLESTNSIELTDTQLLAAASFLRQWQKNSPQEPDWDLGKSYQRDLTDLAKRYSALAEALEQLERELKALGKPRSFFNHFGSMPSEIGNKEYEIESTRSTLQEVRGKLARKQGSFKYWEEQVRVYRAWMRSPQAEKMKQFAVHLSSHDVRERLKTIGDKYPVYDAARCILERLGTRYRDRREFCGQSYRLEERGSTLAIYRQDDPSPLVVAVDRRKERGTIEFREFNLTDGERDLFLKAARGLERSQEQSTRHSKRGLGMG